MASSSKRVSRLADSPLRSAIQTFSVPEPSLMKAMRAPSGENTG